jgi:hypothetical protein
MKAICRKCGWRAMKDMHIKFLNGAYKSETMSFFDMMGQLHTISLLSVAISPVHWKDICARILVFK